MPLNDRKFRTVSQENEIHSLDVQKEREVWLARFAPEDSFRPSLLPCARLLRRRANSRPGCFRALSQSTRPHAGGSGWLHGQSAHQILPAAAPRRGAARLG